MASHGVFITIDGTDGSGKATQTKLLVERLTREGRGVQTISFPQYGKKSAGLVEEYLSGTFGTALDVGPYASSIFFAVDRFDASQKIKCLLEAGQIVVTDRYVGSNMGHQGSKISDPEQRATFFKWDIHLEHEIFKIPRPDINIILHVPSEVAHELITKRDAQEGSKHGLKKDVHESDPRHLKAAEEAYLDMANRFETFQLVECVESDRLLTPEQVHERVWSLVAKFLPSSFIPSS